jgi:hypothetical protein
MNKLIHSIAVALAMFVSGASLAADQRQLVKLTPLAQETLQQEMLDNLLALNEILTLVADNKMEEAGAVAEQQLGKSAMGKNARLPFDARPGPQMPSAMHDIGRTGHFAASEFAAVASKGNRDAALGKLPALVGSCVACHAAYRTR